MRDRENTKHVANNLNLIRKRLNLSLKELSARCDLSEDSVNRYLYSAGVPRVKIIIKICNAIKVSPNELLAGLYEPSREENLMKSIETSLGTGIKNARVTEIFVESMSIAYPEFSTKKLDRRLLELRREAGFNKDTFAELIGLKPVSYAQYESDQASPGGEVFLSMCRVLKVSPEYLLSGDLTFPLPHDRKLYHLTPKQLAHLDHILRVIS